MTLTELRDAVVAALDDESRWTAGATARDADGDWVEGDSPKAVCFCAVGHARRLGGWGLADELMDAFGDYWDESITATNDGPNGRLEVQRMLRELPLSDNEKETN